MTKADLNRKPKKTLILLCTLKKCFKGGKKAAEKKSKESLVNALFKAYKHKGKKVAGHKTPVKKKVSSVGSKKRKFGIDVRSAKDITEINKKIKEKLKKAASYDTIQRALAESRYLYVLSFTPAWKTDLKSKLMSVRRRAKSNYCSLIPIANRRLKDKGIKHVVFTKICKR